jgi:hypothetical protein
MRRKFLAAHFFVYCYFAYVHFFVTKKTNQKKSLLKLCLRYRSDNFILNRYHNVRFVIAGLTRNPLARGFRVKRGMTAFDSSLVLAIMYSLTLVKKTAKDELSPNKKIISLDTPSTHSHAEHTSRLDK